MYEFLLHLNLNLIATLNTHNRHQQRSQVHPFFLPISNHCRWIIISNGQLHCSSFFSCRISAKVIAVITISVNFVERKYDFRFNNWVKTFNTHRNKNIIRELKKTGINKTEEEKEPSSKHCQWDIKSISWTAQHSSTQRQQWAICAIIRKSALSENWIKKRRRRKIYMDCGVYTSRALCVFCWRLIFIPCSFVVKYSLQTVHWSTHTKRWRWFGERV